MYILTGVPGWHKLIHIASTVKKIQSPYSHPTTELNRRRRHAKTP